MKRYNLKDDIGFITEKDGMYTLHYSDGATQSCSKKEIEFYGGIEEGIIETAEVTYEPVKVIKTVKKASKKKASKKKASKKKVKK